MNEFRNYHPLINFIYFTSVIGFSMFLLHPACLCIALLSSILYSIMLTGRKAVRMQLFFLLPTVLCTGLLNPAFNHAGVTVLTYLPSGNPLTLESILYGIAAGLMLITVVLWFFCYQQIMTSDKFIYLFGKVMPSLSLILSMTLRFVPRFLAQFQVVANAQRCIGRDISSGGLFQRSKHALTILSIMITWALENAIETAGSMKSRGYGLPGRTAFSIYFFTARDKNALIYLFLLIGYLLAGIITGTTGFVYFPYMHASAVTPYTFTVFLAYFLLCSMPIWLELWEVRKWNSIKSTH